MQTEAWVLHAGDKKSHGAPGRLQREMFSLGELGPDEVLVEPIFGCWEANMSHALERRPIDVCHKRDEPSVVLGNAGVVRVLRSGREHVGFREGQLCLVVCNAQPDRRGYPQRIYAYDAPGTVGLLAKQTKLTARQLIPLPQESRFTPQQWAAFSLRYITAWANWRVAFGCWQLLNNNQRHDPCYVWGWGGGVAFAELTLARLAGCHTAMVASGPLRLNRIESAGIQPIDRRSLGAIQLDEQRYETDGAYRTAYQDAETSFLGLVESCTHGAGVSIFIDLIGQPVFRATVKALGRPGIVTTAGWKEGMKLSVLRALECLAQRVHVHTHYARYEDALAAVQYGEEMGWMPVIDANVYRFDEVDQLADDYAAGRLPTYFPLYQVNPF